MFGTIKRLNRVIRQKTDRPISIELLIKTESQKEKAQRDAVLNEVLSAIEDCKNSTFIVLPANVALVDENGVEIYFAAIENVYKRIHKMKSNKI